MLNIRKAAAAAFFILIAISAQAEKQVTYGNTTFTVYKPLPELAPTPTSGFAPDVPGYTLKSENYGPGTYYAYAPGNVPKIDYECILTEIRDWVFYRPDELKALAAKRGLIKIDEKTMKKMFKNTRLPQDGLMYKLSENSWIYFYVETLRNSGKAAWSSSEEYVGRVSYIEKVPQQADIVLDKLFRFWNDGVNFADYAGATQSNSKTQASAPTDQNPNNFAIGDVLNPQKGFYRLSFAGGAPKYVWHSYEKVVAANLKKTDFDASGQIGYDDLFSAFSYELNAVKVGQDVYFSYDVNANFISDLQPGLSWQKEMAQRKEQDAQTKAAMDMLRQLNGNAFEKLYLELFK